MTRDLFQRPHSQMSEPQARHMALFVLCARDTSSLTREFTPAHSRVEVNMPPRYECPQHPMEGVTEACHFRPLVTLPRAVHGKLYHTKRAGITISEPHIHKVLSDCCLLLTCAVETSNQEKEYDFLLKSRKASNPHNHMSQVQSQVQHVRCVHALSLSHHSHPGYSHTEVYQYIEGPCQLISRKWTELTASNDLGCSSKHLSFLALFKRCQSGLLSLPPSSKDIPFRKVVPWDCEHPRG